MDINEGATESRHHTPGLREEPASWWERVRRRRGDRREIILAVEAYAGDGFGGGAIDGFTGFDPARPRQREATVRKLPVPSVRSARVTAGHEVVGPRASGF